MHADHIVSSGSPHNNVLHFSSSLLNFTVYDSINARGKRPLCDMRTYLVPNGNDDDVIINYITDMDLGEDSDSHTCKGRQK